MDASLETSREVRTRIAASVKSMRLRTKPLDRTSRSKERSRDGSSSRSLSARSAGDQRFLIGCPLRQAAWGRGGQGGVGHNAGGGITPALSAHREMHSRNPAAHLDGRLRASRRDPGGTDATARSSDGGAKAIHRLHELRLGFRRRSDLRATSIPFVSCRKIGVQSEGNARQVSSTGRAVLLQTSIA